MVLTQLAVVGGAIVTLAIIAQLASSIGMIGTAVLQTAALMGGGGYLYTEGIIGLPLLVLLAFLPTSINVFHIIWFMWIGNNVLEGKYGEEAQWAGELVEEEDGQFIEAMTSLDQMKIREIGIMSDSKEELRERTVDEASDE
jgi:hypothetical protein